jgi:DNA replication protein DnaC
MDEPTKDMINRVVAKLRANHSPELTAQWEEAESQRRARSLFEVMTSDGVPKRFRNSLPLPEQTTALAAVRQWMGESLWSLVVSGPKGVGKSFAAAWWLWTVAVATGRAPHAQAKRRWFPAVLLARMSQYGEDLEALNRLPALVIDDLGVEFNDKTGSFRSRMDYLLDARYGEELPTLITTNLAAEAFERRYGERVLDRIRDGGSFVAIREESRRGK